jgi:hypothetical protein
MGLLGKKKENLKEQCEVGRERRRGKKLVHYCCLSVAWAYCNAVNGAFCSFLFVDLFVPPSCKTVKGNPFTPLRQLRNYWVSIFHLVF